ncbi:MAG: hypothetical protein VXB94_01030 [Rhodobiaceae bacterium]
MTSSFTRDDSGRLTVGGLVLEDIAAAHGTPLYVAPIIASSPPPWHRSVARCISR